MIDKSELRELILKAKTEKGLTWDEIGQALGRRPVGAATICYGYGQCDQAEAEKIVELFGLPSSAVQALKEAPIRTPAQPWPPTDPFIYRIYESLMLYGPAWKDVAHEIFGDGIISAIDCYFDLEKVIDDQGVARAHLVFEGKWLTYKKF